jgi:hypothetical protein
MIRLSCIRIQSLYYINFTRKANPPDSLRKIKQNANNVLFSFSNNIALKIVEIENPNKIVFLLPNVGESINSLLQYIKPT